MTQGVSCSNREARAWMISSCLRCKKTPILCISLPARLVGLLVFLAVLSVSPSAQLIPITVDKIDPPNWRTGPSSDVMLSLSGLNLDRVVGVTVKHKGVRVVHIACPDTNHLFVLLRISSGAEPGTMMLQLSTRFTTTFAALPMFEQKANPSSGGELPIEK